MQRHGPVVQFEIGHGRNFVYLILDEARKKAAIVDPQRDLSGPKRVLAEGGFELTHILLTHTHHDHIGGVEPLLEEIPQLEVRCGKQDLHRLGVLARKAQGLRLFQDGEVFHVGALSLRALHTPGHTAGAFMFFLDRTTGEDAARVDEPHLFTGDTIFIRDCGRTDFEDGSNERMFESIQKVKQFPPDTMLWVGHHYAPESVTTLGAELRDSPPFQCRSVEDLKQLP